uniref:C-type lectin domain-containing protein n=1 Tax=Plectus sambesii TaxID=2011161 RepID=A0A914USY8_9BILA
MLFSLAILLFTFPTVTAQTDLQANCTGNDRLYNGTSCYVMSGPTLTHYKARLACNHILGYSGHLAHMRNAAGQAAVLELANTYTGAPGDCYWMGMELINASVATNTSTNWGNYYRNGTFVTPTYFAWDSGQPSTSTGYNRVAYCKTANKLYSRSPGDSYSSLCEYEEAMKQPVTDLEQKCAALGSSFQISFVDGICYVLHPETKSYNDAKIACNDLSGYIGHLAHVSTLGQLYIASILRSAAGAGYVRIGIEQTNPASTDPTTGWYLTTPTSPSVLTTYLPWAASNPTAGKRTIAMAGGYPNSFNAVANTTLCSFL